MSRRLEGKEADEGRGCAYMDMAEDVVRRVVEGSRGWPEGGAGKAEGVVRLEGGGRGKTDRGDVWATGMGGRVCLRGAIMEGGCGGGCGA